MPQILRAMDRLEEIYFDRVSQVVMDHWSKGRTMLIGDAASCISLLGGEGTGLALIEAYVLAVNWTARGRDATGRPLTAMKNGCVRSLRESKSRPPISPPPSHRRRRPGCGSAIKSQSCSPSRRSPISFSYEISRTTLTYPNMRSVPMRKRNRGTGIQGRYLPAKPSMLIPTRPGRCFWATATMRSRYDSSHEAGSIDPAWRRAAAFARCGICLAEPFPLR